LASRQKEQVMSNHSRKKLSLAVETVRALDAGELAAAHGGITGWPKSYPLGVCTCRPSEIREVCITKGGK